MAPKIRIVFDEESKIYRQGQTLKGHVEVTTKKKFSCKVLQLQIEGLCFVDQNNRVDRRGAFRSESGLTATEVYYDATLDLLGEGSSKQAITEGIHSFDFAFALPLVTPSSFESKFGYVRYCCRAKLEIAMSLFPEVKCSETFTVRNPVDLNTQALLNKPMYVVHEKKIKTFTSRSGLISSTLRSSHVGYVPGENIVVEVECSNRSKRLLAEAKLELVQTLKYKVLNHSKEVELVITANNYKFEVEKENYGFQQNICVPPLPPSFLTGCSLIDVSYSLRFSLVPKAGKLDFVVSTPLEIGTVPLKEFQKKQDAIDPPAGTATLSATASATASMPEEILEPESAKTLEFMQDFQKELRTDPEELIPSAPPLHEPTTNIYPDLPPPSYEESVTPSCVGRETHEYTSER